MMFSSRYFSVISALILLIYAGCSEVARNHPQTVEERCAVCHEMPPNDSASEMMVHYYHLTFENLRCWNCHLNCDTIMVKSTVEVQGTVTKIVKDTIYPVMVWTHDSLHRNGRLDLDSTSKQCRLCHNYRRCDDCHGVPPKSPSNPASQRVHEVHVTRQGFGCDTCHKGYDPQNKKFPVVKNGYNLETTHDNGEKDVIFNVKRKPGMAGVPFYNPFNQTCNNLYCHGAATLGGRQSVAIKDEMSLQSRCSFCHDIDVLKSQGPIHSVESHSDLFPECLNCHPGFQLRTFTTNSVTHRNIVLDTIQCTECDKCHSYPHACVR